MWALGPPCWSRTSRGDGEGPPGRVESPVKTAVNNGRGRLRAKGSEKRANWTEPWRGSSGVAG